jgi:hypothetical protein
VDYTTQTFVDDDGSGTTGTVITKAIMDHIEAGILDAAAHNRIGALSSRPAAAAANKNWLWIATDTDGTGGLYISDGSAWTKMPVGAITAINTRFGTGGLLRSSVANNAEFRSNYNAETDRLIDTSLPSWLIHLGLGDLMMMLRAAPTVGSPSFVEVQRVDGTGQVTMAGTAHRFGVGGELRAGSAGVAVFSQNYNSVTDRCIDTSKPAWRMLLDSGSDVMYWQRAPATAGSPAWVTVMALNGSIIQPSLPVRFGTGGNLQSPTADNAKVMSNYDPVSDRLIDTSKAAWQMVAGTASDVFSVWRAPATAGSPVWVQVLSYDSANNLRFGFGGNLNSFTQSYILASSNYNSATDRLIDTAKPAWAMELDGRSGQDQLRLRRAAPTAGSPVWTKGLYIDSALRVRDQNGMPLDSTPGFFGDGNDGAWTAQVTPTNVLANPDAEADASGWAGFFTGGGAGAGPTRVADVSFGSSFAFELSETGATGAGVLLMYPPGTASFVGSAQNVVPGQVVDFSGQVKAQAGTFTSLKLTARWLRADGSLISEVDVSGAIQNTPVVGTVYSISGSQIAPAGAAYAGVEVVGSFAGAGSYTMRVDNMASRPLMPGSTRSGAVYTLTRDVYFTNLTVNSGVSINANGYRVFVSGTLTGVGSSFIIANGAAGSGRNGGAGSPPGSVLGGFGGGGAGGNGAANGAGSLTVPKVGGGGGGGSGGAGSNGFTGGGSTTPTAITGNIRRSAADMIFPIALDLPVTMVGIGGGGAGGGGGGSSTAGATGGGGGGSGGVLIVAARILAGTIGFSALGGDGAAGTNNGGGGGGGGGGLIHLLYGDKATWTGTTNVSGGAAGAGNGTGSAGGAGSAGNVVQLAA